MAPGSKGAPRAQQPAVACGITLCSCGSVRETLRGHTHTGQEGPPCLWRLPANTTQVWGPYNSLCLSFSLTHRLLTSAHYNLWQRWDGSKEKVTVLKRTTERRERGDETYLVPRLLIGRTNVPNDQPWKWIPWWLQSSCNMNQSDEGELYLGEALHFGFGHSWYFRPGPATTAFGGVKYE